MDGWLAPDEATRLLDTLVRDLAWEQRSIRIAGKTVAQPRLSAWYGDPGAAYTYSGLRNEPLAWAPPLASLRDRLAGELGVRFDSVLANLYRDGRDAMGMHADDERELGTEPLIASVSLGATRTFVLAPKKGRPGERIRLPLASGSLLVMGGRTQHDWKHGVPREPEVSAPRVNLTFRRVVTRAS